MFLHSGVKRISTTRTALMLPYDGSKYTYAAADIFLRQICTAIDPPSTSKDGLTISGDCSPTGLGGIFGISHGSLISTTNLVETLDCDENFYCCYRSSRVVSLRIEFSPVTKMANQSGILSCGIFPRRDLSADISFEKQPLPSRKYISKLPIYQYGPANQRLVLVYEPKIQDGNAYQFRDLYDVPILVMINYTRYINKSQLITADDFVYQVRIDAELEVSSAQPHSDISVTYDANFEETSASRLCDIIYPSFMKRVPLLISIRDKRSALTYISTKKMMMYTTSAPPANDDCSTKNFIADSKTSNLYRTSKLEVGGSQNSESNWRLW